MITKKNFKFTTALLVPFLNKPNKKGIHRNKVQSVTILQQEVSNENNSADWKDFFLPHLLMLENTVLL